ncbi:MAG: hypothetical protein PVI40_06250 [Chlamydiota bacterium]
MQITKIMRLSVCLLVFTICLFSYLYKQNDLTRLKMQVPKIHKQLQAINEEIRQLQYEIDQFENPARLMEMACHPDFNHLKHPLIKDIETIPEGVALSYPRNDLEIDVPACVGSR